MADALQAACCPEGLILVSLVIEIVDRQGILRGKVAMRSIEAKAKLQEIIRRSQTEGQPTTVSTTLNMDGTGDGGVHDRAHKPTWTCIPCLQ